MTQKMPGIPTKTYALVSQGRVRKADYFYFETRPDNKQPLAIVFGGYEMCQKDFEIRRRTYPYYIIELGLKGLCNLTINNIAHRLTFGTLAGFSPGIPHHYKADAAAPFEHYWLAFVGTEAEDLFTKSSLARLGSINVGKDTISLIEQIIAHSRQKTPYAQQICSSYLRILLLSLPQAPAPPKANQSRATLTYQRCRKYIDENFSSINLPSQVASACDVNIRYMSRLFKLFGSTSPHDYISRLKLNKAANMLLASNLSVGDIAKEVGFEDPYHFSRNFRLFHGLSPHNYRKTHLGTLNSPIGS